MSDSKERYDLVAQSFHWIIAALILVQFFLATSASDADEAGQLAIYSTALANHMSVGITILVLVALRLTWRLWKPQPSLPEQMPGWQKIAAKGTHYLFYLLLFVLPVSGWMRAAASGESISWFTLIDLPGMVGPGEELEQVFSLIHYVAASLMFLLMVLHVAAALKHQFRDRDGVLTRMLSPYGAFLFIGLVVLGRMAFMPD